MWCGTCKQDVPGIASAELGKLRCLRCQSPLDGGPGNSAPSPPAASADPLRSKRLPYDAWEAEEKLRHIGRLLRGSAAKPKVQRQEPTQFRADGSHGPVRAWHAPAAAAKKRRAAPPVEAEADSGGNFMVWTSVSLGVMSLVCGGVLMAWSVLGVRPELWNVGLPIAVLGQIALVLGLVLQLDRLWHHHRQTAAKLDNVDDQIHRLRNKTARLDALPVGLPSVRPSHLAEGANPQTLLTDLKSQLDRLTVRLSQINEDR